MRRPFFQALLVGVGLTVSVRNHAFAESTPSILKKSSYLPDNLIVFDALYKKNGDIDRLLTSERWGDTYTLLVGDVAHLTQKYLRPGEEEKDTYFRKHSVRIKTSRPVKKAFFSQDGTRVVTSDRPYKEFCKNCRVCESLLAGIHVYDANTGAQLHLIDLTSDILATALSPDGQKMIVASKDNPTRIWDLNTSFLNTNLTPFMHPLAHSQDTQVVAFSPDGQKVATGSNQGVVRLWDAKKASLLQTLKKDAAALAAIAFSPDGSRVAAATSNKTVHLWDTKTGSALKTLRFEREILSVAFSPNGNEIAVGGQEQVLVRDVHTGLLEKTLFPPGNFDHKVGQKVCDEDAYSADGPYGAFDGFCFHAYRKLAFSSDGKKITAFTKSGVDIFNAAIGNFLYSISSPP